MKIEKGILNTLYELNDEEIQGDPKKAISDYFLKTQSNFIILKNQLFTSDRSIHLRKHTRFMPFPLHSHDYVECTFVIAGSVTHIIDNQKMILHAGDMILLNQNSSHEILACSHDDIAINFIIKPSFLKEILTHSSENSEFSDFIIRNYINHSTSKEYYIFREVPENIKCIISLIINHYYSNDSQEKINLLFTYVLTELFTNHLPINENNPTFDTEYILLFTRKYIDKEYYGGSLDELSELLNISYCYLSTCIKKELGASFKQLQQIKRLEVAMRLAKKTTMPIKEIAHMVGYENMTFFYKIFKEHYGDNPYAFRTKKGSSL